MRFELGPALFCFFVLGWTYYMVGTILMRGSIFEPLRQYVARRAPASRFWSLIQEMLGCMMCTTTEAALWTLGLATFIIGVKYGAVEEILSAVLGKPADLHRYAEVVLMVGVSFAISLAVSGQAWVIKTVFEHREQKFLTLREEFRNRELELLTRIGGLEMKRSEVSEDFKFDLS